MQQVRDAQKCLGERISLLNVVKALATKSDYYNAEATDLEQQRKEQEKQIEELKFRIKLAEKLDPKLKAKLNIAKEAHLQSLGKVVKRIRQLRAEQEIAVLKVISAHKIMERSENQWSHKMESPMGVFHGSFGDLAKSTPTKAPAKILQPQHQPQFQQRVGLPQYVRIVCYL